MKKLDIKSDSSTYIQLRAKLSAGEEFTLDFMGPFARSEFRCIHDKERDNLKAYGYVMPMTPSGKFPYIVIDDGHKSPIKYANSYREAFVKLVELYMNFNSNIPINWTF